MIKKNLRKKLDFKSGKLKNTKKGRRRRGNLGPGDRDWSLIKYLK